MQTLPRTLIILGLILVAAGVLIHLGPSLPFLGRLPGDIRIERPGLRIYVPITTCILLSVIVSVVLWIVSRLR